jgi:hypothetical protein
MCVTACCFALALAAPPAPASAQERGRIVEATAAVIRPEAQPLELVEIRAGGGAVDLGRPFQAGDDWLKGLTLRLRNISAEPISSLSVMMDLSEARRGGGALRVELTHGASAGSGARPDGVGYLMPGSEVEVRLTGAEYERVRQSVGEAGLARLSRAVLRSVRIEKADGTTRFVPVLRRPIKIVPARPEGGGI